MRGIDEAIEKLNNGQLVIYPTETCYGLGADATNSNAINKVFEAKKRDKNKPLSVLFKDLKMAEQYCEINEEIKKIVKLKPLTIITKKKNLPHNLSGDLIGFRLPSHPIAKELVSRFGRPITATSANKSGKKPTYKFKKVVSVFPEIFTIDGGNLPNKKPSTVWNAISGSLIRKGPVRRKEIHSLLE